MLSPQKICSTLGQDSSQPHYIYSTWDTQDTPLKLNFPQGFSSQAVLAIFPEGFYSQYYILSVQPKTYVSIPPTKSYVSVPLPKNAQHVEVNTIMMLPVVEFTNQLIKPLMSQIKGKTALRRNLVQWDLL